MNHAEAGLASGAELEAEEVARDQGVLEQGGFWAQASEEGDLGSSEQGRGRC